MNASTTRGPDTPSWRRIVSDDKRLDQSRSGYAFLAADSEWRWTAGPLGVRRIRCGVSTRMPGNTCASGNEKYRTRCRSALEELDGGPVGGEQENVWRAARWHDRRRRTRALAASTSGDWDEEDGENGAKPLHASQTPTGNSWTDERVGTDEIDPSPVGIGLWHRWVSLLRRGSASLAVNKTTNEVSVSNKKRRLIASVWYSLNSCIYSGIACTVERDRLPAYVLGGVDV